MLTSIEDAWARHLRIQASKVPPTSPKIEQTIMDENDEANDEEIALNHLNKDIVGHASLLSIIDKSVLNPNDQEMGLFSQASVSIDDIASRYHSRQSTILGKWVVKPAVLNNSTTSSSHGVVNPDFSHNHSTNDPISRRKAKQKLCTDSAIYFEQDLYCLSVAPKESYSTWPKISLDFVEDVKLFQGSNDLNFDVKEDQVSTRRVDSSLQGFVSSTMGIGSKSQRRKSNRVASRSEFLDQNIPSRANSKHSAAYKTRLRQIESSQERHRDLSAYVVLKKITYSNSHIRLNHGKTHATTAEEYVVDRRSVFQFYSVENSQFLKDNKTQQCVRKLMDKARAGLKNSEMMRKGHREYNYKGRVLYSGEQFTKSLKSISMQNTFDREHEMLASRRLKEQNLPDYFQELMASASEVIDESIHAKQSMSQSLMSNQRNSKVLPSIIHRHEQLYGHKYNPNNSLITSSQIDDDASFFTTAGSMLFKSSASQAQPIKSKAKDVAKRLGELATSNVDSFPRTLTSGFIYHDKEAAKLQPTLARDDKSTKISEEIPSKDSKQVSDDRMKHLKILVDDQGAISADNSSPAKVKSAIARASPTRVKNVSIDSTSLMTSESSEAKKRDFKTRVTPSRFLTSFNDLAAHPTESSSAYHGLTPGEQILLFRRELELANLKAKVRIISSPLHLQA
jgi:hypothetical protein